MCCRNDPLWEGTSAKRVGERSFDLVGANLFVSPSVTFGDRAPPLALRATSPVSGGVCLAEGAGKSGRLYKDPCPRYTEINTTKGDYP